MIDRLLHVPPQPPEQLRALVDDHVRKLMARSAEDPELTDAIAGVCRELLDAWATFDEDGRRHVQAACLYFAETSDEEDDFDSIVGLDDDAEAVAWIAGHVGRQDLRARLEATWR